MLENHPNSHSPAIAPSGTENGSFLGKITAGLVFSILALLVWAFIRADFGISWDQSVDLRFGQAVFRYFFEGFDYQHIAQYPIANLKHYSPLVSLLSAISAKLTGGDLFSCAAAVIGIFWVATFWPVCGVAKSLGGEASAWLAGLALFAMPAFLGHAFINAKDLPFACAVSWFVLAVVWASHKASLGFGESLILGMTFGFVLAVRPGGFFVGILLLLPIVQGCFGHRTSQPRTLEATLTAASGWVVLAVLLAWVFMVLPWPSAHKSPIWHPVESMLLASKFHEAYPVLFNGETVQSNKLPWNYYFVYFGVTIPPFLLAGVLVGQARLAWLILFRRNSAAMAVLFLSWFPLTLFLILRMNVYDGIRHFLFLLPLFAIAAGAGGAWIAEILPRRMGTLRYAVPAIAYALALPQLWILHPYQYAYYNTFAGPKESLHERFETDYWVTSYREAAEWINASPAKSPNVILAANAFSEPAYMHFASPGTQFMSVLTDLRATKWPKDADYYVGTVRYGQHENFEGTPVVKRIERGGILMSVIKSEHAR